MVEIRPKSRGISLNSFMQVSFPIILRVRIAEKNIFSKYKLVIIRRDWMNSFGKKIIDRFVKKGVSPHKVAWSSSWGMYLAFSPFLGIQTILVFIVAFFFRAQASLVF